MSLDSGCRLGPYEILSPIGAGGMGEVYEAKDTRLGRTVAVKVLPEGLAENPERRARFEREARTISQLSHPHVCTLHDVGEEEGIHFLVMEHLEGETLAARLERGALPLEDTLRFGAQIAEALDAAHRRGVIHRDLKPGNVMLTSSGVKLLDFGLARVAAGEAAAAEHLPTMSLEPGRTLTEEGTILGTYPYMSPEQVEGVETDARSDIFALGAVLYEMVTGRRAFRGKSAASVMAAVLREEPEPISKVEPVSPPALDHVVSRCLAKDPEERWQNVKDVAVELQWVAEAGSEAGVATPVAKRRKSRVRLAWGLVAIMGLTALVLAGLLVGSREEPRLVRIPHAIPDDAHDGNIGGPAVSPDGSTVVYSLRREGQRKLYLHPLADLEAKPIVGTEGGNHPFFSPDGRWIAFFADGELRKIPARGGSPTVLCEVTFLVGGGWGEDGTIVFSTGAPNGLWRVSESGGDPIALTDPRDETGERRSVAHMTPHLLPGDSGLLFSSWNPTARQEFMIAVVEPGSDEIRFLLEGVGPLYARSGHLLYVDATQRILYAVPFDLDRLEVRGEPKIVARDVDGAGISDEGTLSYQTIRETPQRLVWLGADGSREILSLPEREYEGVRLSPDGRRAAVVIEEGTNSDVWGVDLERGTSTRLTPERFFAWDSYPVWSPEGDRVLFSSDRDGPPNIYRVFFQGGEVERLTNTRESMQRPHDITADGRKLVVETLATEGMSGRDADLALIDLETGSFEPLIASPADEGSAAISPDGRWLAYGSEESGERQIYLQAFPGLGSKRQVTVDGFDGDPRWSPDGGTLYYARGEEIMAVAVRTDPELEIGEPVSVAEIPELMGFDVAPDGRLLLIERIGPRRRGVVTVLNWFLALRGDS